MKYNIFNDSFYKYKLTITDQEKIQLKIFLQNYKEKKRDQITTYENINILNLPLLLPLKKQVISILDKHKLQLKNNWAQLYEKGDYHPRHNHNNTCYGGIIYVDGFGKDGTLFHHPLSCLVRPYGIRFKQNHLEIFQSGTMILFPGYIEHEVLIQKENNHRTVIAFNTIEAT